MWIKICGNTNLSDSQHAASSGASALGFIFAPSPRRVTIEQVRAISPHLPRNVERYGVFVNATLDEIITTVEEADLTGVQLHANGDPELPGRLRENVTGFRLSIISVLAFNDHLGAQIEALARHAAHDSDSGGSVDAVLVDSRNALGHGGTGTRYDWHAAQQHFRGAASHLRIVAAGGLDPDNVAEAIQIMNPWGVDVATGVEAGPGRKDPARVAAFIRNARQAFALQEETERQSAASG
jgi:phosphoribosylanthranilate isomerase